MCVSYSTVPLLEKSCRTNNVRYNLGLQSVGLARREVEANVEAELFKCNSLSDLRKLAAKGNYLVCCIKFS